MSILLFNINDLALILAIAACLFQTGILSFQHSASKYNIFLSLFLVSIALSSFDMLIYWSVAVKNQLLIFSPHVFFIFKISLFLQAPLLFFYVKSVIYFDFCFSRRNIIHFLPAIFYILSIPLMYYSLGWKNLDAGIHNYSILFADPIFRLFMWASKLSYIAYGFLSLWMLKVHNERLKDNISNTDGVNANWLRLLVVGFVCLWLLGTLAQVLTQVKISGHILSLIKNYAHLVLIVILVFLNISRASNTHKQNLTEQGPKFITQSYTSEHIQRIHDAMGGRQVYLDPDLSLDKLSKITSLPKRLLSFIVNHHFEQNFFEFVNSYRVEHAKKMLTVTGDHLSMIDVMTNSGFNSKSAFNRFFKKFTDMTPTQYRSSYTLEKIVKV